MNLNSKNKIKEQETKDSKKKERKKREYIIQDSEPTVNFKFTIIALVAIIAFSIAITPVTLQNDTYYTIKIGEHIIQNHTIDLQDPFSWHENLPYFYPHWLYDAITYLLYQWLGFKGIFLTTAILSGILGATIYFVNVHISKNRLVSFLITLGAMYLLKPFIAARAQLTSFILFALEVLFIEKFLETKKKRYGIGLFLIATIIANIHSAVWPFFFVLALPYIAEYLLNANYLHFRFVIKQKWHKFCFNYYTKKVKKHQNSKKIEQYQKRLEKFQEKLEKDPEQETVAQEKQTKRRKNPYRLQMQKNDACKWLILIFLICVLTGFLTPIKDMPFSYTYRIMQGNTTKSISEHLPLTLINNKELLIVLVGFLAILIFTDTKIRLKDLFMLSGLTLLTLITRRQESMFLIFCGGVLAKLISDLFAKYDKDGSLEFQRIMTSVLGTLATMLIITLFVIQNVKGKKNDSFVNESSYPVQASNYIKENLDYQNIRLYNEYNYGSYLLFQDIPVFIDSRCDLYTPQFNKTEQDPEGKDIFSDYIKTSNITTDYDEMFKKYQITHIILYKNSKLSMLLKKQPDRYRNIYSDLSFVIYEVVQDE